MFENVGRKVQTLAKVVCWLGIISSIISGIAIWISGSTMIYSSYSYYDRPNTFLPGLITILLGSFVSWLSSLSLYAIGEAAEYAESNNIQLTELTRAVKNLTEQKGSSSDKAASPSPSPSSAPKKYLTNPISDDGNTWRCSKCGTYNDLTAPYCKDCGNYR